MQEQAIKEIEFVANVQITFILKREDNPDYFEDHLPQSPEELALFKESKSKEIANIVKTSLDADDVLVTDCKYFEKDE